MNNSKSRSVVKSDYAKWAKSPDSNSSIDTNELTDMNRSED